MSESIRKIVEADRGLYGSMIELDAKAREMGLYGTRGWLYSGDSPFNALLILLHELNSYRKSDKKRTRYMNRRCQCGHLKSEHRSGYDVCHDMECGCKEYVRMRDDLKAAQDDK